MKKKIGSLNSSTLCGTVFVSKLFGWKKKSRKCSSSLWLLEPKKICLLQVNFNFIYENK
jgi:hypothetical protein